MLTPTPQPSKPRLLDQVRSTIRVASDQGEVFDLCPVLSPLFVVFGVFVSSVYLLLGFSAFACEHRGSTFDPKFEVNGIALG